MSGGVTLKVSTRWRSSLRRSLLEEVWLVLHLTGQLACVSLLLWFVSDDIKDAIKVLSDTWSKCKNTNKKYVDIFIQAVYFCV